MTKTCTQRVLSMLQLAGVPLRRARAWTRRNNTAAVGTDAASPLSSWDRVSGKVGGTRRLVIGISVGAMLAINPHPVSAASDGTLDTTFGTGGKVITDIAGKIDAPGSIVVQSDGKIIVPGYTKAVDGWNNALVLRYNPDGTLDASFGTGGKVITPIGQSSNFVSAAILPGGKILAAGTTGNIFASDFLLVRYNANGTLDTDFGTGGIVTTTLRDFAAANQMAVLSGGTILLAGQTWEDLGPSSVKDFALVRYNDVGTLDTTFDTDGIVTTDIMGGTQDNILSVVGLSNGKILAAGNGGGLPTEPTLVRYNADGSLDTSFDTDGIVTTDFGTFSDYLGSVVELSDGKILAAGQTTQGLEGSVVLVRYNDVGTLDTSFGTGGIVSTIHPVYISLKTLTLLADGKILTAGIYQRRVSSGSDYDYFLYRYNADGTLDTSFGTGGEVIIDLGTTRDQIGSVVELSDGKILTAGMGNPGDCYDCYDIFLVRLGNSAAESDPDLDLDIDIDLSHYEQIAEVALPNTR